MTTMREARQRYFEENGFGPNGGYDDAWVDFKLGPIPFPFPNTKARVRAVKVHDLHHILTGYRTDYTGELEIGGWEIGAGCKDFGAAWVLNLGAMASGLFVAPRRVFAAFVRGRRERSLYGEDVDALLDAKVEDVQARFASKTAPKADAADVVLFALACAAGLVVGLVFMAFALPLVPVGLLTSWLRKRATRAVA